jgi:hypothetical protein
VGAVLVIVIIVVVVELVSGTSIAEEKGARLLFPSVRTISRGYDTGIDRDGDGDAERVFSMYIGAICLDRPGAVSLKGVKARDGELNVTSFWVLPGFIHYSDAAPGENPIGDALGPISAQNYPPSPDPLTLECNNPDQDSHQLQIEVHGRDHTTSTSGFILEYESGGESRELNIEYGIALCAPQDARDVAECATLYT